MTESELRDRLRQLHDELARTDVTEASTRAALRHVSDDIQAALHRAEHAGLAGRLESLAVALESEHPVLASTARSIIDALVKLGF